MSPILKNSYRFCPIGSDFRNQCESQVNIAEAEGHYFIQNGALTMNFPFDFNQLVSIYLGIFSSDLLRYVIGAGGIYLLINVLLARGCKAARSEMRSRPKVKLGEKSSLVCALLRFLLPMVH